MIELKKVYSDVSNIEIENAGSFKVRGYKTLAGYFQMIKRQNKKCKKLGIKLRFDITLPIKEK